MYIYKFVFEDEVIFLAFQCFLVRSILREIYES